MHGITFDSGLVDRAVHKITASAVTSRGIRKYNGAFPKKLAG
jgi:hypothetical protein